MCVCAVDYKNTTSSCALTSTQTGILSGSTSEWRACNLARCTRFTSSIYANQTVSTIMVSLLVSLSHLNWPRQTWPCRYATSSLLRERGGAWLEEGGASHQLSLYFQMSIWTSVGRWRNFLYSVLDDGRQLYTSMNVLPLMLISHVQEFPVSEDRCYIAHCFPYPYSKLLSFVEQLQICPQSSANVQCEELCKSLAGNTCPLITITEFQGNNAIAQLVSVWSMISLWSDLSTLSSRAGIVVSARVHPGESNSSWMMEGLMEWLTSDSSHAKVNPALLLCSLTLAHHFTTCRFWGTTLYLSWFRCWIQMALWLETHGHL